VAARRHRLSLGTMLLLLKRSVTCDG
jgi:hypothetical protein